MQISIAAATVIPHSPASVGKQSTYPLLFPTPVAQQQKRFFCAVPNQIGFTGIMSIALREDGQSNALHESRKMRPGMNR